MISPESSVRPFIWRVPGDPAPSWWICPKDVINAKTEFKYPKKVALQGYKPTTEAHMGQIKRVYTAITKAKKPVIYAGGWGD